MLRLVEIGTAITGVILAVVAVGALVLVLAVPAAVVAVVASVRYSRSVEGLRECTREALDEEERRYFDEAMQRLAIRGVDAPDK